MHQVQIFGPMQPHFDPDMLMSWIRSAPIQLEVEIVYLRNALYQN